MTKINEMLIKQIDSCLSETSWFAAADLVFKNITVAEATWKDESLTNSIVDIVNHLTYWNLDALLKFTNKHESTSIYKNEETFFKDEVVKDLNELEQKIEKFKESLVNWKQVLADCDLEKLEIEVYPGRPWWQQISFMLLHTAHHLGQIIYMRKKLGTWDPVKWDS